jgi:FkbM family methyltransferase
MLRHRLVQLLIATGTYRGVRRLQRGGLDRRMYREFQSRTAFLGGMIQPGDLCFDVGANKGDVTEALLFLGAKVVAFEPQLELAREIIVRFRKQPSASIVSCALGAEPEFLEFFESPRHGESSLNEEWVETALKKRMVPVLTLDTAIRAFGRPFYCKVDVEGWESFVFSGLSESIPLVSFDEYHRSRDNIEKTLAVLRRLIELGGYRANVTPVETSRFRLHPWMPLADFIEWFSHDLPAEPDAAQGDIFVATEQAVERWS